MGSNMDDLKFPEFPSAEDTNLDGSANTRRRPRRSPRRRSEEAREVVLAGVEELHDDAYQGELETQVSCREVDRKIPETFHALDLELGESKSVRDALTSYTMMERLEGDNQYKWEYGPGRDDFKMVDAEKRTKIYRLPPVLMLPLRRFGVEGLRIRDRITYDQRINFLPFTSPSLRVSSRTVWYNLVGMVALSRDPDQPKNSTGRYSAYVKGGTDQWYWVDDQKLQPMEFDVVRQARAHVLVYEKDSKHGQVPLPAQAEDLLKSRKRPFPGEIELSASDIRNASESRKSRRVSVDAHLTDAGSLRSLGNLQRNSEENDKPLDTPSQERLHSNNSNEREMETGYFHSQRKERLVEESRHCGPRGGRRVSLMSGGRECEEDMDVNPTSGVQDPPACRRPSEDNSQVDEEANVRHSRKRALPGDDNEDCDPGEVKKVMKKRG